MSKKAYLQEADAKLSNALQCLIKGATIKELAKVLGSEGTAYRMMNRLESNYGCVISNADTVYRAEKSEKMDDNMWGRFSKALDERDKRDARLK